MIGNRPDPALPSRRTLVRGKLNVVGETHTESDARRDEEKRFALEKTGSANYWTEAEFLDGHLKGGRGGSGGQAPATDLADMMEFRAAHGAALLITRMGNLAPVAAGVGQSSPADVRQAIRDFLDRDYRDFKAYRERVERTWRDTATGAVNTAVQAVYNAVDAAFQAFVLEVRDAEPAAQVQAARNFADRLAAGRNLVGPLADAVGVARSHAPDALALSDEMRKQRSSYMGLAAVFTAVQGVWKVGDGHVTDLTNGTAKVDLGKFNIVSRDDFNAELAAWQATRRQ